ncbi:MAG: aspartate aminotransferase family protein, partial [Pseudomonadota bacterium]
MSSALLNDAIAAPAVEESPLFYQDRRVLPDVDRAEGIYIWDADGKRYIDGASGAMVVNIGHGNPAVIEAMQAQLKRVAFAYRLHFKNQPAEELAHELVGQMPDGLNRVFLVSGGSEAVESCLKLARQYVITQGQATRYKVISRFPSYHGCTLGALSLTGYTALTAPFSPMMVTMPKVPAPFWHREEGSPSDAGARYAKALEDVILAEGPDSILAFIMEPVGGASTGALVAPDNYYAEVRNICDRYGVLLIHDEVLCGAARTGAYLAGDHWATRPDLIALSKGLASGYAPLGAMVAPDWMVEPVLDAGGFEHGFSYAGNPVSAAAGLAALRESRRLELAANAGLMGDYLINQLVGLKSLFPFIGDVRGKGLLTAIELVVDRTHWRPLPAEWESHERIVDLGLEHGLILYARRTYGGLFGDHVLVTPPLVISKEQIDDLMSRLHDT